MPSEIVNLHLGEIHPQMESFDIPHESEPDPPPVKKNDENKGTELLYNLEDIPPWYLTGLLGFQHYITMVGGSLAVPYLLLPRMCIANDDLGVQTSTNIICTILFCSGLITLGQTNLGTRLPIIQGGSFSFLVPSLAILGSFQDGGCPPSTTVEDIWQPRMRNIQGAIITASLFQIFIGSSGLVGILLKYITPLTIAPSIAMMGISLFGFASSEGQKNWWITISTIILITIFSQYLPKVNMPLPYYKIKEKRFEFTRYPIFQVFPVLLGISLMWIISLILTAAGAFGEDSPARTDFRSNTLEQASWIKAPPYPFQWGWPTFSIGPIAGMFAGALAGIVESIGDYYACSRIVGLKRPPKHAVNRGILIEGFGCLITGCLGTGDGTTSYSENIGALTVTKVGSRRVIQASAVMMIVFSFFPKFGALIISIPEPIVAGVFYALFSIVIAVGLSNLRHVDMSASRNIFILGFSILFSLSFAQWMKTGDNKEQLQIGNPAFDQLVEIILSTDMFLAGILGFILDNTIPGTKEQRGLISLEEDLKSEEKVDGVKSSFDLPYGSEFFKRHKFFSYVPFLPVFDEKPFVEFSSRVKLMFLRKSKTGSIQ